MASVDPETGAIVEIQEAPGDGTITRTSALGVLRTVAGSGGRLETSVDWRSVHFVEGNHLDMVKGPGMVDNLLYLLLQAPILPTVSELSE